MGNRKSLRIMIMTMMLAGGSLVTTKGRNVMFGGKRFPRLKVSFSQIMGQNMGNMDNNLTDDSHLSSSFGHFITTTSAFATFYRQCNREGISQRDVIKD